MIEESPSNEKKKLIAELNELMKPQPRPQSRYGGYNSYTANKVVDKLFVRLGIVAIIGLLGYIIIKNSTNKNNNNNCRCD